MAVQNPDYAALLVGLESSGKTTMFLTLKGKKWKAEGTSPPQPTLGCDTAQVSISPAKEKRGSFSKMLPVRSSQKKTCTLYDVGGSEKSRSFLDSVFKTVGAVVLVIDSNSSDRLGDGVDTLAEGVTVKSKLLDVRHSTETTVPLAIVLNNKGLEADSLSLTKEGIQQWLDLEYTINGERLDDEGSHSESKEQMEGETDDILREPIPSPPTATRLRTVQRREYKVFECDTRDKLAVNDVMDWLLSPKGPTLSRRKSFGERLRALTATLSSPTEPVSDDALSDGSSDDTTSTPGGGPTPGSDKRSHTPFEDLPMPDERSPIAAIDLATRGPSAKSCPCQFAGVCKKDAKFSHPEGKCCLVCGKWYCYAHVTLCMAVAKKHGTGVKCFKCKGKPRTDWEALKLEATRRSTTGF